MARMIAAAAVAGGLVCMAATPASAQSLTDRFKSLFGGKSDEEPAPAAPGGAIPQDTGDLTCPPVTVRAGAFGLLLTGDFMLSAADATGTSGRSSTGGGVNSAVSSSGTSSNGTGCICGGTHADT